MVKLLLNELVVAKEDRMRPMTETSSYRHSESKVENNNVHYDHEPHKSDTSRGKDVGVLVVLQCVLAINAVVVLVAIVVMMIMIAIVIVASNITRFTVMGRDD